ncbi:MAG: hypothetical protein KVP17_003078 [Porospora cf. gigantea B]|uniref:uncharacterized protein n=1 Tax=Porospora cf. gigantea B TaxID=2853592 RepID=UPI003571C822|nr:MAG: hypothetical protein KVP17_003078 [Porospora cf. gigantea B]
MGNYVVFPFTPCTYTEQMEQLVYVPSGDHQVPYFPSLLIPCRSERGSRHCVLYFHGNSCDIGDMKEELSVLQEFTNCHLMAVEYPGYGITQAHSSPDHDVIDRWGIAAFLWLVQQTNLKPENIVLFGRSIGTGPAARLATWATANGFRIGGLVLHSPYKSIHSVVQDYASSFGKIFVTNYWDIEQSLAQIQPRVPLLILHGQNDEIIPCYHGFDLFNGYSGPKACLFPEDSPHNEYLIIDDIAVPLSKFLRKISTSREARFVRLACPPEYRFQRCTFKSTTSGLTSFIESTRASGVLGFIRVQ